MNRDRGLESGEWRVGISPLLSLISILLTLISILYPPAAAAKPLVADLSQYRIEIDARFTGTRLLLFGARNDIGDIVVVVRGPERDFTVRRKEHVRDIIWMNHRQRHFDGVPAFYAIATSKPFTAMRHTELFGPLRIGLKEAVLKDGVGDPDFAQALIEREQANRLYSYEPQKVSFMGESLFKMVIPFPDNIIGGNYTADVYLFNDGQIVGMQSIPIYVEKSGFDAWIYDFAHAHSVLYGLAAVTIAIGMGLGASSLMRRI
jgi:uncharacterized protein (TIGR02186 family)